MKRITLCVIIFLNLCTGSFGQKKFRDNLFFGGNVGLQLGNVTMVEISPLAGYHVTHRLSTGIGAKYQYYKDNRVTPAFKTNIYGGNIFSSYTIIEEIPFMPSGKLFTQAEYEILSLERHFKYPLDQDGRFLMHNIFIGSGYSQKISKKAALSFIILWNLNDYEYSPYSNPVIRIELRFNKQV